MNTKPRIPRPEPTDPELSDAEETHKISASVVARAANALGPSPDSTSEVDATDILSADIDADGELDPAPALTPDATGEVDALDIVSVESIDLPTMRMPTIQAPPRRIPDSIAPVSLRTNEPTQIIRRTTVAAVARKNPRLSEKRVRTVLMLAAALGTWGFFASFAVVGTYGAYKIFGGASHATNAVAQVTTPASPSTPPTIDESANADPVAPLLYSDRSERSENTNASSEPAAPTYSRAASVASTEIFRRPSKTQVGVLRLPTSVSGVLVDGAPQRVSGGALILACGDHRIRAPHASARVVRVPCGKTVTL